MSFKSNKIFKVSICSCMHLKIVTFTIVQGWCFSARSSVLPWYQSWNRKITHFTYYQTVSYRVKFQQSTNQLKGYSHATPFPIFVLPYKCCKQSQWHVYMSIMGFQITLWTTSYFTTIYTYVQSYVQTFDSYTLYKKNIKYNKEI